MAKVTLSRIACLLLTCVVLSPSTLMAAEAAITVTQEQNGREIALKVGDILRISFPGEAAPAIAGWWRPTAPLASNSWTRPPNKLASVGRDHR